MSLPTADEINRKIGTVTSARKQLPYVIVGGVVACVLLFFVFPIPLILTWLAVRWLNQQDEEQRTFEMRYERITPTGHALWSLLRTSLGALAAPQFVWAVTSITQSANVKRTSGAHRIVTRIDGRPRGEAKSPFLNSDIKPIAIDSSAGTLYFFPDRLFVWNDGRYCILDYRKTSVECSTTRFIENEYRLNDAEVAGATWRYPNKDGSRDRRFKENWQIPVVNYGLVVLHLDVVGPVIFQTSNKNTASQFAHAYAEFVRQYQEVGKPKQHAHTESARSQSTYSSRQADYVTPECFHILGLNENCTREEALAKYRELAMAYHPDRMQDLAIEAQEIASRKLAAINRAFRELKQLRGW